MADVSLVAAFVGGVLSFISPCVLPLIPGYLSFVSGFSMEDLRGAEARASSRRQVLTASLAFVAGFSVVFIALGASASAIGEFLMSRLPLLGKIAGVLIIIFLIFEPLGLYGIWLKIRNYWKRWPFSY